ncbi:hypothetical protein DWB68_01300 [Galactobacter valiniphilus]|uniref:DUF4345 domain-containing protein n=2 Tax=Galactobacter valiniphilus TaxID=2676122 RepID=A0A399JDD8_9MICC|nr:hypothetical protein [Galactobacter valiniphilus]RII43573.1 hypothetical protein DWB68_01300 [Galactobacter valiniphilus]
MLWWLDVLTTLISAATVGFAVVGLLAPARLVPPGTSPAPAAPAGGAPLPVGTRYYAAMYAVRAIPLGVATALAPSLAGPGWATIALFAVGAAAQLGDLLIGAAHRQWGQVAGPALATLVFAAAAFTSA